MIKITDSTVFNTNADCIVNTVNCVGVMGKGIALEFALRYPELEKQYKEQCKNKLIKTGQVYYYEIDGQKIINFPTKFHFRYPSKILWIEEGLKFFVNNYKKWNIKSIAFPLLGSTNGGLDPKEVEQIMIKYLSNLDIDVFICHSRLLEGKELEMVTAFKETPVSVIENNVRLTSKQSIKLETNKNKINRFVDISKIEGIGPDTYKALFRMFYFKNDSGVQLSLF